MFRIRLLICLSLLLALMLFLAGTLYWSMQRTEHHMLRSQLANQAAMSFTDLSQSAYRYFKELTDKIAINRSNETDIEELQQAEAQLWQALGRARDAVTAEVGHFAVDGMTPLEESRELDELALLIELEAVLKQAKWELERVRILQSFDDQKALQAALNQVLNKTIDQQFKPMIDLAISDELEEVVEASARADEVMASLQRLALLCALLAALLAGLMGWWLWRSFNRPVQALLNGVKQVTQGNLQHQTQIEGRNEFSYLAHKFNQMTQRLDKQHQDLLQTRNALEDQVWERTQALEQANKRLQQLDKAKRRFFADISHELRTPLAAIRGEAEVTMRGKSKPEVEYRQALQCIVELSGQLATLVDDLLSMARTNSANIKFDMAPLECNALIERIAQEAASLVREKSLDLVLQLPPRPLKIMGDEARLRQLLLILLDNACRYTRVAGSEIVIRLITLGHRLQLSVSSHSQYLSEDECCKVFERHYRGAQARANVPEGSGLGLALAKEICEAHHGSIAMESEPDGETCIRITLPLLSVA